MIPYYPERHVFRSDEQNKTSSINSNNESKGNFFPKEDMGQ